MKFINYLFFFSKEFVIRENSWTIGLSIWGIRLNFLLRINPHQVVRRTRGIINFTCFKYFNWLVAFLSIWFWWKLPVLEIRTSQDKMWETLEEAWDQIPKKVLQKYIFSMNKRSKAVIAAKGGHTLYWVE